MQIQQTILRGSAFALMLALGTQAGAQQNSGDATVAAYASVVRTTHGPVLHGMVAEQTVASTVNSPFAPPPQMSRRKAITLGVVIGAAVGATAGYFIAHDSCDSCDDSGPVVLVSSLGAVAGGLLGGFVAAQNTPPGSSQSALRSSASRNAAPRVAHKVAGYQLASFR